MISISINSNECRFCGISLIDRLDTLLCSDLCQWCSCCVECCECYQTVWQKDCEEFQNEDFFE